MGSILGFNGAASGINPTVFIFQGRPIRVIIDENGEALFVGKDACEALGFANDSKAMGDHCKGVTKRYPLQTAGGMQQMRVLAEPDLLRLIVNCSLPAGEAFERWVFEDVLPTIRRTGAYSVVDPLASLPPEQRALVGVMIDNAAIKKIQVEQGAAIVRIEQRVAEAEQTQLVHERPTNSESIMHIRARINKAYGLSDKIVDEVMRQSPYALKPACMVRHKREEAKGASYAVFWIKDVNAVFRRFVSECEMVTATQANHPLIAGRFKLTLLEAGDER